MHLTAAEGRVLGCLVEKQLTTPQLYPLTDSALIAACNQTTSRDPVVSYDLATVRLAVRSLREQELLRTVHRTGERSDKHEHRMDSGLGLSPGQTALLAVLLLRGPQTAAELRARTERMHPFGDLEQVVAELDGLGARDEPLAVRLELQPGRKEPRYAQVLVEDADQPAVQRAPAQELYGDVEQLRPEVEALRSEVATLHAEVAALRREVATLRGEDADLRAPASGT